jgi:hypothetical protein
VRWANEHTTWYRLVFITFRNAALDGRFDWYVDGQKIDPQVTYVGDTATDAYITSGDVYNKIREHFGHYETGAYLGGTASHDKITWLCSAMIGSKGRMYGSVGAKVMELAQIFHHAIHGTIGIRSQPQARRWPERSAG